MATEGTKPNWMSVPSCHSFLKNFWNISQNTYVEFRDTHPYKHFFYLAYVVLNSSAETRQNNIIRVTNCRKFKFSRKLPLPYLPYKQAPIPKEEIYIQKAPRHLIRPDECASQAGGAFPMTNA